MKKRSCGNNLKVYPESFLSILFRLDDTLEAAGKLVTTRSRYLLNFKKFLKYMTITGPPQNARISKVDIQLMFEKVNKIMTKINKSVPLHQVQVLIRLNMNKNALIR